MINHAKKLNQLKRTNLLLATRTECKIKFPSAVFISVGDIMLFCGINVIGVVINSSVPSSRSEKKSLVV